MIYGEQVRTVCLRRRSVVVRNRWSDEACVWDQRWQRVADEKATKAREKLAERGNEVLAAERQIAALQCASAGPATSESKKSCFRADAGR